MMAVSPNNKNHMGRGGQQSTTAPPKPSRITMSDADDGWACLDLTGLTLTGLAGICGGPGGGGGEVSADDSDDAVLVEESAAARDSDPRRAPSAANDDDDGRAAVGGPSLDSRSSLLLASSLADAVGVRASGNFLSAVVAQMWNHANVAVSNSVKEALEPTLKELPVGIHIVKLDLGDVPIQTTNMFIHRLDPEKEGGRGGRRRAGIQIDVDVEWNGNCDVMLQANMTKSAKFPFGVRAIKLSGRMHILLSPLTTELPVVSAVQFGFTNPPDVRLEFTGAVKSVASLGPVQSAVGNVINSSLASMLVLPHRMVVPIDLTSYDFLDAYQPPAGMVRLAAVSGRGFKVAKKFLYKDVPDVYCRMRLGASEAVRTSTRYNDLTPSWGEEESFDFVLYDMDQKVYLEAFDEDRSPLDPDDELGRAEVRVRDLFRNDGACELELRLEGGKETGCFITLSAELFGLSEGIRSFSSPEYGKTNQLCGLATIIVTRGFDIPIPKEDASTYVEVVYGRSTEHEAKFCTGTVMDYPGCDGLNPTYDSAFHVPISAAMMKGEGGGTRNGSASGKKRDGTGRNDIEFRLIDVEGANGTKGRGELGAFTVTHESLRTARRHTVTQTRPIGDGGAKLEFRVILSGMESETEKSQLSSPQPDGGCPSSTYGGMVESNLNVRVTALRGRGFQISKRKKGKKEDVPDVYCVIHHNSGRGAPKTPEPWKTATVKDDTMPRWNEAREFSGVDAATDLLRVDAYEENRKGGDELIGSADFSVERLLRKQLLELELRREDGSTSAESYVTLRCVRVGTAGDEAIAAGDGNAMHGGSDDISHVTTVTDTDDDGGDTVTPLRSIKSVSKKISRKLHMGHGNGSKRESRNVEQTMKEVRSIEETVSVLRTSIRQMEQNGDSGEDVEDVKRSIKRYTGLRKDLERSLFEKS